MTALLHARVHTDMIECRKRAGEEAYVFPGGVGEEERFLLGRRPRLCLRRKSVFRATTGARANLCPVAETGPPHRVPKRMAAAAAADKSPPLVAACATRRDIVPNAKRSDSGEPMTCGEIPRMRALSSIVGGK